MKAQGKLLAVDQPPVLRRYDTESLPRICHDAPDLGYTILIVPAFGACHRDFAENSPDYEDMYAARLVAGVHLDDLGKVTPKVLVAPVNSRISWRRRIMWGASRPACLHSTTEPYFPATASSIT